MDTQHTTLSAAMIKIEDLISEGYDSFKLFKSLGMWNVIVNGESK